MPQQGVMANTLNLYRNGAVGFIDWLDGLRGIIPDDLSENPICCA